MSGSATYTIVKSSAVMSEDRPNRAGRARGATIGRSSKLVTER